MSKLSLAAPALAVLVLAACARAPTTGGASIEENAAAAQRIRSDVRALADDRMQGRLSASPGFDLAAQYVATRMNAIGLQPAGDDGSWFQRVPLLRARRDIDGARLAIERDGTIVTLQPRAQFIPAFDFTHAQASIRAPAVFVGHGIAAPGQHYDDFAGLDLHGRIAVLFSGAPSRLDPGWRARHASLDDKLRALARRGAVGAVFVNTVADEAQLPWAQRAAAWDRPGLALRDADGQPLDAVPGLQVVATVSASAASVIFAGSGHDAAALFRDAQAGTLHGFDLPATLALSMRNTIEPVDSRNVLGQLRGSDPARARQLVVLSAHLDHLGTTTPVAGDGIDNGALDNALGVAIGLESARVLTTGQRPARSLLWLASTGEEQGLLGARWLVLHPPGDVVADINVDMPLLLAPTRDIAAIGAEHSSLQGLLQQAAHELDLELGGDPYPQDQAFLRSDQYAFVRAGIPAVYLDAGANGTTTIDPRRAQRAFMRRCYHRPCDDLSQSIQYGDAGRLARLQARLALHVANASQRPRWHAGDAFAPAPAPVKSQQRKLGP